MESLAPHLLATLQGHANDVRQGIIRSLLAAGSGHSAGSLDMADVFTAFYFHLLRHDPKNPDWEERDRLLLSCGHIAPVRYSAMAYAGYFPVDELLTLRKFGTRLQGHPERISLPGLETTSGPLGEGLAQGTGMALGAKMDGADWRVYVVTSDGEHQCGLHWEAMMTAAKFKLDNLTCVVDRNFIQIDGSTEDVMPLEPLADKYRAFNWEVFTCDGNDIGAFIATVERAKAVRGKPQVVIANTVPGKGVSFMEHDYLWHGKPPKADEADVALRELLAAREAIGASNRG
ncbi:MAG: putative transketolase N-terminal section [Candidatus Eremiobacteraeota bacterium]|nr:putative transketolase N-terminal section [Candidatus Eremiobacteraeota bacterium]